MIALLQLYTPDRTSVANPHCYVIHLAVLHTACFAPRIPTPIILIKDVWCWRCSSQGLQAAAADDYNVRLEYACKTVYPAAVEYLQAAGQGLKQSDLL